jgi:hypothetical protein
VGVGPSEDPEGVGLSLHTELEFGCLAPQKTWMSTRTSSDLPEAVPGGLNG